MARRASLSRNMKQLSIAIPEPNHVPAVAPPLTAVLGPRRRPSAVSLPAISAALRRDEEPSPSAPYADGPALIVPGVWLGSEDNARDWPGLARRGIAAILNVAKEVSLPFDLLQPSSSFLYPSHAPSGRPPMHYLKLQWSHGQQNLVDDGFKQAMSFTDAALQRGDGVLIQYVVPPSKTSFLRPAQLPVRYISLCHSRHRSRHACGR
jgi:tyrosine-protein phosphatase